MKTTLRKLPAVLPLAIIFLLPALGSAETAVQAWVQRYDGLEMGECQANAVAADRSGNVIVVGSSFGSGS